MLRKSVWVLALLCPLAQAGELTVSAASSLSEAFKEVATAYEARTPGDKVLLNIAASGALLQQMAKGAPVDVFASADEQTMQLAISQGLVKAGEAKDFAGNLLVLVVPPAAKVMPKQLTDLNGATIQKLALGNPDSVPAGRYAQQALQQANLWSALQPRLIPAQNVRQALDYVARGEVDAGFVYQTDALQFKDKVKVAFTVPLAKPVRYPLAALAASTHPAEAQRFVRFVLSAEGQAILRRHGFQQP